MDEGRGGLSLRRRWIGGRQGAFSFEGDLERVYLRFGCNFGKARACRSSHHRGDSNPSTLFVPSLGYGPPPTWLRCVDRIRRPTPRGVRCRGQGQRRLVLRL